MTQSRYVDLNLYVITFFQQESKTASTKVSQEKISEILVKFGQLQLKLRYFYQLEFKKPNEVDDKNKAAKQSEVLLYHSLSPGKLEKQA